MNRPYLVLLHRASYWKSPRHVSHTPSSLDRLPGLLWAAAFWGISASNTWAITQTLAGPQAAGKWTGLQNFLGNLAGWIAPVVTGFVVDKTGRFFWGFHHHCGHRLAGLAVLDIYCRHPSTGGLGNSPGLRRFALIYEHAVKVVGSEQTSVLRRRKWRSPARVVYISRSIARCSSEVSERKT